MCTPSVYNTICAGAWDHARQCQGRWRPGEPEAHECPHCQIVEMKTGEAVLFRGATGPGIA